MKVQSESETQGWRDPLGDVLSEVADEARRAEQRYGDMSSTHEGLGVLIEEMDELRQAIRANAMGSVYMEAVQIAAVAARLAVAMSGEPFRKRSGA